MSVVRGTDHAITQSGLFSILDPEYGSILDAKVSKTPILKYCQVPNGIFVNVTIQESKLLSFLLFCKHNCDFFSAIHTYFCSYQEISQVPESLKYKDPLYLM